MQPADELRRLIGHSDEAASAEQALTIMTFNVLARPYTKYNHKHHRNSEEIEDSSQTQQRYERAGTQILGNACDLVFLQECERAFFDPVWNVQADQLMQTYHVFLCTWDSNPGTAVLVKKNGRASVSTDPRIYIGGTNETGGTSKSATIVPVRVGAHQISAVSVHFTLDAEKRLHHANSIGKSLEGESLRGSVK